MDDSDDSPRPAPRLRFDWPIDALLSRTQAAVLDLSITGARILYDDAGSGDNDDRRVLEFELFEERLVLPARVVWSTRHLDLIEAGVQFVQIGHSVRACIHSLLERAAIEQLESRAVDVGPIPEALDPSSDDRQSFFPRNVRNQ